MTNREKFLAVFGIQVEDFLAMPKDKAMAWGDKETTPTTSSWITDRRPSYCEDVLVTFTTGEIGIGRYLDFDEPWCAGGWYFGDEDVVAWMPLPEPWEEDWPNIEVVKECPSDWDSPLDEIYDEPEEESDEKA